MATHLGVKAINGFPGFPRSKDLTVQRNPKIEANTGNREIVISQKPGTQRSGVRLSSDPGDAIFDKIYLIPEEIDFGFITEETSETITLWNSFRKTTGNTSVTGITEDNADGLDLQTPPIPLSLPAQCATEFSLVALVDGPPIQNAFFIFSIGAETKILSVTGRRLLAFPFEPNWANGVDLKLKFETVVNRNKRFTEQRRAVYDFPNIEQSATFNFYEEKKEKFKNYSRNIANKVLGIPIYSEPITTTDDVLQGLSTINTEDTTDETFLNIHARFCILFDRDDNYTNEIKEIENITANTIEFKTPIIENFSGSNICIYPIFIGVMRPDESHISRDLIDVPIEFREVFI